MFKKGGKLKLQKNFLSEPKFDLDAAELEIISMMEKPEQMDIQNLLINVRSIQSFGAMEKILKLCIEYCSQRKQFGRKLSKFQMIQNHISEIALEVAASGASLSTLKNNNKNSTIKTPYQIFNIGNSQPTNLSDYVKAIEKHLKRKARIILEEMQPGDVEATYANTKSLEEYIGFKPNTSIDDGIKKFIDWYLSYYKIQIN